MTLLFAFSCHVVIITTKFGEFMPNSFGGDSVTDGEMDGRTEPITISPSFFKKRGDKNLNTCSSNKSLNLCSIPHREWLVLYFMTKLLQSEGVYL